MLQLLRDFALYLQSLKNAFSKPWATGTSWVNRLSTWGTLLIPTLPLAAYWQPIGDWIEATIGLKPTATVALGIGLFLVVAPFLAWRELYRELNPPRPLGITYSDQSGTIWRHDWRDEMSDDGSCLYIRRIGVQNVSMKPIENVYVTIDNIRDDAGNILLNLNEQLRSHSGQHPPFKINGKSYQYFTIVRYSFAPHKEDDVKIGTSSVDLLDYNDSPPTDKRIIIRLSIEGDRHPRDSMFFDAHISPDGITFCPRTEALPQPSQQGGVS